MLGEILCWRPGPVLRPSCLSPVARCPLPVASRIRVVPCRVVVLSCCVVPCPRVASSCRVEESSRSCACLIPLKQHSQTAASLAFFPLSKSKLFKSRVQFVSDNNNNKIHNRKEIKRKAKKLKQKQVNLHTHTPTHTLTTVRTIHHSASSAPASALSTKQPSNPLQPPQASSVTGSVPRCSVPRSVQFNSVQFRFGSWLTVQHPATSTVPTSQILCRYVQRPLPQYLHPSCTTTPLPCLCSPFCIYSIIMRSVCCQNLLPKRKEYFIKHGLFLEVSRHLCSPRACMNECAPESESKRESEREKERGEYVSLGLLSHRYWKRRRS